MGGRRAKAALARFADADDDDRTQLLGGFGMPAYAEGGKNQPSGGNSADAGAEDAGKAKLSAGTGDGGSAYRSNDGLTQGEGGSGGASDEPLREEAPKAGGRTPQADNAGIQPWIERASKPFEAVFPADDEVTQPLPAGGGRR